MQKSRNSRLNSRNSQGKRNTQNRIRWFFVIGAVVLGIVTIFCRVWSENILGRAQRNVQFGQNALEIYDPLAKMATKTAIVNRTVNLSETINDGAGPPRIGTESPGDGDGLEGDDVDSPVTDSPGTDLPGIDSEYIGKLLIWAVNPGYRVDEKTDVGEFIELRKMSSDAIDLTGFSLRYTNGSGKSATLIEFPDESVMQGERILLRYAKSPESDKSDLVYTTSLAMLAGPLELWRDDELIDTVCWNGKLNCEKAFKSSSPTTLVRKDTDKTFEHVDAYLPEFDTGNPGILLPDTPDSDDGTVIDDLTPRCRKIEFTEVYAYYVDNKLEQFIELYNPSDQAVNLEKCSLRYKKKTYPLDGIIASDSYYAYFPQGKFSLTKNPNTSNTIELVDVDGRTVDELVYLHGQKKSTSYAKFYDATGAENWSFTYARTPGEANVYQEFRSCEAGKVINPETGNCVKVDEAVDDTGTCPAGKYRNPLTGRCKKIEQTAQKECAPGYERNPETKRCRKIKSANTGADYTLVPTTRSDNKKIFIAAGVVAIIIALGILYVVWQFRREIVRMLRKVRQRIHDIREDLVTRRSSRHLNKKP